MPIRDLIAAAIESAQHPNHVEEVGASALDQYYLADVVIDALGGVEQKREYGTVLGPLDDGTEIMMLDYAFMKMTRDPKWHNHEVISYASPWIAEETTNAQ